MARPAGLEPADAGVKVLCLTCLATTVYESVAAIGSPDSPDQNFSLENRIILFYGMTKRYS